ncbi:hypothetical protein GCM10010156_19920 [Planobispora rosea]|uniref:DUF397 domain-containing protein n=1 Tax=Planobispora rosea TaxID=35762 RepID=A0A8J3RZ65_PLARO|nr:DUF397 domain-containing protein [Planobispora rosea]GGS61160.1 hypothetical protein GCM10010156_19920 [Planobispora rosea]GIH83909.1 hypothetical protein Pro02_23170 [Planobispora rosea]
MTENSPFNASVWHRPCNGGNCLEVAFDGSRVGVRDSKNGGTGPVLTFDAEEWTAFVRAVRRGRFDIAWFRRTLRRARLFSRHRPRGRERPPPPPAEMASGGGGVFRG